MIKLFTRKQETRLINAYFYMKHYEEYLRKMLNEDKLLLAEYNNLSSDIKHAMKYLSAVIAVHTDDIYPEE